MLVRVTGLCVMDGILSCDCQKQDFQDFQDVQDCYLFVVCGVFKIVIVRIRITRI